MKKTNTFIKRIIAIALAVVTLFSMAPIIEGQEVDAASANTVKTTIVNAKTGAIQVFCPNVKITVYRDIKLSDPQGWVKAEDIKITGMSNTALKISYYSTATKSTRTGYINFTAIFPDTNYDCWSFNATKTIRVNRMSNGTTKYGAITNGDKNCLVVGEYLGKYIVIYPVTGKNYSKMGLVAKSDISCYAPVDLTVYINDTAKTDVQYRLDSIINGSLSYNSKTVMKVGSKFTGYRSGEQCKGYAKNVFYLCFKVTPGSTQSKPNNYLLSSVNGIYKVGSVTTMNETNIRNLFANARPGDFVQMRRTHSGSHSAIVYSVTNDGVTFLEANLDNKNTVSLNTYTWAQLCSKNAAMSVYTASDYRLK